MRNRNVSIATTGLVIAVAGIALLLGSCSSAAITADKGNSQPAVAAQQTAAPTADAPTQTVSLVIKSDEENAKLGSDGQYHDAFLPADFTVKQGDVVKVTIENYDDMPHSFTSPDLGVDQFIKSGSEDTPSTTTFTFTATKAGAFGWYCKTPCDPWAMKTAGFMKGTVTVS